MMFIRQMCGKKTLLLYTNSRITKDFENEKDIEVVVTSKKRKGYYSFLLWRIGY